MIHASRVKSSTKVGRQGDRILFLRLCQAMMTNPAYFKDMSQLMNTLNHCILDGVGLNTSIVMLVNKPRTQLRTYFAQGTNDREGLRNLVLNTQEGIIGQLMEKQASLWVGPNKAARILPRLPEALVSQIQTQEFFLYSLHVGKRPVALVYADGGPGASRLTNYENEGYKQACSSSSNVLYYLARKKKQKS